MRRQADGIAQCWHRPLNIEEEEYGDRVLRDVPLDDEVSSTYSASCAVTSETDLFCWDRDLFCWDRQDPGWPNPTLVE